MDYPAENYIEISFGWKLADCDEFQILSCSLENKFLQKQTKQKMKTNESMKSSMVMRLISQVMMNTKISVSTVLTSVYNVI